MKTTHLISSFLYSIAQITLGLVLHPYQTMQSLLEDKVFVWMTLLPSLVLAVVTLTWRWLIVPSVQDFYSCQTTYVFICDYLSFIGNCLVFFCIYWQILLLYLLFRFRSAYR